MMELTRMLSAASSVAIERVMANTALLESKCDDARDLLAPVYGCFTDGFDTLDLKEAKTLLNELRA